MIAVGGCFGEACFRLVLINHHTATQLATRQESSGNASTSDECFVKCEESITSTSDDDAIGQPQWMDLCRVCVCSQALKAHPPFLANQSGN